MMILAIVWNQFIPLLNVVDNINVLLQGHLIPNETVHIAA